MCFKLKENWGEKMSYQVSWELLKEIAVLETSQNGWTKEINLVSWNGEKPKYDVRWWSPDKKKLGKGMTLTPEELSKLRDILPSIPENLHVLAGNNR